MVCRIVLNTASALFVSRPVALSVRRRTRCKPRRWWALDARSLAFVSSVFMMAS
jgi:hypothetical protein